MVNEAVRVFVCIDFPDSVVKEVARVQEVLENLKFDGKMTELENLHLTLKFLGEISLDKLDVARKKLKEIKFNEFDAHLSEIGSFSHRGNPRIVWVKVGGKGIFELQKEVDDALSGIFPKEERFMSHMTIARIKYVKDKKSFIDYTRKIGIKEIAFKVDRFKIMKSELRPEGPVYSLIEEFLFQ